MLKSAFARVFLIVLLIFFVTPLPQLAAQMMPFPGEDSSSRDRSGRDRRTRDRRSPRGDKQMDGMARDAADDISFKLEAILDVVHSGKTLQPADIKVVEKTLADTKRYFPSFPLTSQCEYHLLGAWTNYFAGQPRKALSYAEKAFEADNENEDAHITKWAMAILSREYRAFSELAKTDSTIFAEESRSPRSSHRGRSRGSQGVLNSS